MFRLVFGLPTSSTGDRAGTFNGIDAVLYGMARGEADDGFVIL
jgi:hypothetical protein